MLRASVLAPAKVNLSLRVLGRRPDGYHLLESLMVPISLYDRLEIAVIPGARGVSCRVTGPERVAGGAGNLAAIAARAVIDEIGGRARIELHLDKEVPAGAGLGGGSSDAAAVLRVLPKLVGSTLSAARLQRMALAIGADVPFFLACRPAIVTGIGEILEPVASFPRIHLLVVVPAKRVDTGWAYANALPKRSCRPCEPSTARPSGATMPARFRLPLKGKTINSLFFNDFARGVKRALDDVGRLERALLEQGAVGTVMSGSGSAVVGAFATAQLAREARSTFSEPDKAFAVEVLRRRPPTRVLGI